MICGDLITKLNYGAVVIPEKLPRFSRLKTLKTEGMSKVIYELWSAITFSSFFLNILEKARAKFVICYVLTRQLEKG